MSEPGLYDVEVLGPEAPRDPVIAELMAEAQRFAARGFTPSYGPGDHGNMSARTAGGLVITARETSKAQMAPTDFVAVLGCQAQAPRPVVRCRGPRLPSTDAWLHWRLCEARPDVNAILHGHDTVTLQHARPLRLPLTAVSAAQPSAALVEEVVQLALEHDYILLRDHGFVALGPSVHEAAALAHRWALQSRSLK